MAKYKKKLVQDVREKKEFEQAQQQLKEKSQVQDKDTIIIEKDHFFKFTIRTVGSIIRVVAGILCCVLAAIGTAALIYPAPREELLQIGSRILEELLIYVR